MNQRKTLTFNGKLRYNFIDCNQMIGFTVTLDMITHTTALRILRKNTHTFILTQWIIDQNVFIAPRNKRVKLLYRTHQPVHVRFTHRLTPCSGMLN